MSYTLPLQKAIFEALRSSLAIYDRVPNGAAFPYVSFGPSDENEDDAECIEGVEVTQQLDVWSRKPGFPESREIAGIIRQALHRQNIILDGAALAEISIQNIRYLRDPDGITTHAVVTIRAIIERG